MRHPGRDLLRRAVFRGVGAAVTVVPIGAGLDHRRAAARSCPARRGRRNLVDGHHVVAVHQFRRQAVGRRPVRGRVGHRGHRSDRGVLHVQVVLADEEHRELPHRCQVERLVERADVGGSVSEEGHRDLIGAAQHRGPRRTRPPSAGAHRRSRRTRACCGRPWSGAWIRPWRGRSRSPCSSIRPGIPPELRREPSHGDDRGRWRTHSRPDAAPCWSPTATASCPAARCVVPLTSPRRNRSWAAFSVALMSAICSYQASSELGSTAVVAAVTSHPAPASWSLRARWSCRRRPHDRPPCCGATGTPAPWGASRSPCNSGGRPPAAPPPGIW